MRRTLLAAVTLLAATGAWAAQPETQARSTGAAVSTAPLPASAAVSDAGQAVPEEQRKICRTERATGSLTRRNRICLTAAQWREVQDRTRRGVGELQGSASGGNQCTIDPRGACQGSQTPGASFP